MFYLNVVWKVIQKDLILEWRQKSFVISLITLALLLLLISSMALEGVPFNDRGAGFLWVILLSFSSISGYQLLNKELTNGSWRGLFMAPVDSSAIFYGKWLSQLLILFFVELVIVPVYFLLFNFQVSSMALLLITLVLGTLGFSVVTTFISSLALKSSMGAILLPVLQLPILIPLFLASISMTELAVYGMSEWPLNWLGMLIIYNLLFILLPWILFPIITEVES
jgi:heme exporter protein B